MPARASRPRRSCRRWGTSLAAAALRPVGVRVPDEVLNQLRYGRGLDNRKLKGMGYAYAFTTRETVLKHAEAPARALVAQRRGGALPLRA